MLQSILDMKQQQETIIMEELGESSIIPSMVSSAIHSLSSMLQHEDATTSSLSSTTTTAISPLDLHYRSLEEENITSTIEPGIIDLDITVEEDSPLAIFSAVMSNLLLFFLIFGLSATVNLKDLKHQLTNKFAIGTGVTMQFIIMPLLGFIAVMTFNSYGFTKAMGISLLVVTSSPGGSYSNWWCSLFNAELALSVAMTSVSSLLSIGLLPANLFLYGWLAYGVVLDDDEEEDVNIVASLDFGAIFITLGVVMSAILLGLYVGYKFDSPTFHERANYFGSFCGIALILFSAFLGSGAGGSETNFWSLPWSFYVGTAFPCILGMSLANIISRSFRLSPPEVVAISIECCYQNTAIATSVAVTMFSDPTERAEAVSVPLFYGVIEAIIIGIYCVWAWKVNWTKAPADEKLCVVMTRTYEVHGMDHDLNDDDGFIDPQELENLHWWRKCFVPRYPDYIIRQGNDGNSSSVNGLEKSEDGIQDETRIRFYSEDVTVSTNHSSPPSTPNQKSDNTSDQATRDRTYSDVETPSIRKNNISAIDELVEEGEATDDGTSFLAVAATEDYSNIPAQNTNLSAGI